VVLAGIGGSNLHAHPGHYTAGTPPLVLGHEAVARTPDGSRVALIGCAACRACRRGERSRCERRASVDLTIDAVEGSADLDRWDACRPRRQDCSDRRAGASQWQHARRRSRGPQDLDPRLRARRLRRGDLAPYHRATAVRRPANLAAWQGAEAFRRMASDLDFVVKVLLRAGPDADLSRRGALSARRSGPPARSASLPLTASTKEDVL
jgi:Alcohol dehydrogenase GroES-like domain